MTSLSTGNSITNLPVEIIQKLSEMTDFDPEDPTIDSCLEVGLEVGAAIGMVITPLYSDKLGFIKSLIISFSLLIVTSFACMIPLGWVYLTVVRVLSGLCTSSLQGLAPLLIGEVLNPQQRGKTMMMYSIFFNVGISTSYFIHYFISFDYTFWFLTFSTPILFSIGGLAAVVMMLRLQSVKYKVMQSKTDANQETSLARVDAEGTMSEIEDTTPQTAVTEDTAAETTDENRSPEISLIKDTTLTKLQMARLTYVTVALGAMQTFSGDDAIFIYSSNIFKTLIDSPKSGIYGAMIIGAVNIISVSIVAPIAEHNKRRLMLIIGVLGAGLSEIVVAVFYVFGVSNIWILIFITSFFVFYNTGPEPIVFMFFSELFPPRYRSRLSGIGWTANWIANIISVFAFDFFEGGEEQYIYTAFGVVSIVLGLSGAILAPETHNKSLRDIEKQIRAWEWKKKQKVVREPSSFISKLKFLSGKKDQKQKYQKQNNNNNELQNHQDQSLFPSTSSLMSTEQQTNEQREVKLPMLVGKMSKATGNMDEGEFE